MENKIKKKRRLQARFKFKWSTVEHYIPPEKTAVEDWRNRFRGVKKQLGRSFKTLSRAAAQDLLPDSESWINT